MVLVWVFWGVGVGVGSKSVAVTLCDLARPLLDHAPITKVTPFVLKEFFCELAEFRHTIKVMY